MRRHLHPSPDTVPFGATDDTDAAPEDAYEVEVSSYNRRVSGIQYSSSPSVSQASSLPRHSSLAKGSLLRGASPVDRTGILRSPRREASTSSAVPGIGGSSAATADAPPASLGGGGARPKKSVSEISFFNSRNLAEGTAGSAAHGRPLHPHSRGITHVEDGEGGVFRESNRPMDELEATGHLQHAIMSMVQLLFLPNAAEDEDEEVHRTVTSINHLRRYPNAIDFFAEGDGDDGTSVGDATDTETETLNDGDLSGPPASGVWGSAEDLAEGDNDGTASLLSDTQGGRAARKRNPIQRFFVRRRLDLLTVRAARYLKSALWILAPFASSTALIGVFALPAATALSGWCILLLLLVAAVLLVGHNVRRLTAMCVHRLQWPLSPMELDEVTAAPPPGKAAAPAVSSYVFVAKSLLALADAVVGYPFRLFTALLVIFFNCAAAVVALSVGLPLVGGGYNSLAALKGLPSGQRVYSAGPVPLSVEGCRFDIRAHLIPLFGCFLLLLLCAGPTPLRRLQYWTTNIFRLLTAVVVLFALFWTGVVPLLADAAGDAPATSLGFVSDAEWFPINIAVNASGAAFTIPAMGPDGTGSAMEFLYARLGVSFAMTLWLFACVVYSVRSSGHHLFGAELLRAQRTQLSAVRQRLQDAIASGATPIRAPPARPSHVDERESLRSSQVGARQRLVDAAIDESQKTPPPTTSFLSSFLRTFLLFAAMGLFATCAQNASSAALRSRIFHGPLALLWVVKGGPGPNAYRCTVGIQDGLQVHVLRISAVVCFLLGCLLLLWVPFFVQQAAARAVTSRRTIPVEEDENDAARRFLRSKKKRAAEEDRETQQHDILLSSSSAASDQLTSMTRVRRYSIRAIRKWNVGAVCRALRGSCRSMVACCNYWGGLWRCCDRTSRRNAPAADDVATEFDGTKVSVLDVFERLRRKGATRRRSQLLAFVAELVFIRFSLLLLCVFCAVVTLSGERVRCKSFWSFWLAAPYASADLNTLVFKSCDSTTTPLTQELFVRITLTIAITGGIIVAPLLLFVPLVIILKEEWLQHVKTVHHRSLTQAIKSLRFWKRPGATAVTSETPPAREYSHGGFAPSHNTVSMSRFSRMSQLNANEQRLLSGFEITDPATNAVYGSVDGQDGWQFPSLWSCPSFLRFLRLSLFTVVSLVLLHLAFAGGVHASIKFLGLSRHHLLEV